MHPNEAELIAGDSQGNLKIYDLVADKIRFSQVKIKWLFDWVFNGFYVYIEIDIRYSIKVSHDQ